jgi:threonine aldolase
MDAVKAEADAAGLPIHLDGARIFNAAAALGCEGKDIAARADSVMFCLSKGLCAPIGSLLAGKADFVGEARFKRKIMGGGMRQAGIIAAAGILALTEQRVRLAEDHERAKKLARFLAGLPGVACDPAAADINMVFFDYPPAASSKEADRFTEFFRAKGILINSPDKGHFRFVTHAGIGDGELQKIMDACAGAFGKAGGAA